MKIIGRELIIEKKIIGILDEKKEREREIIKGRRIDKRREI